MASKIPQTSLDQLVEFCLNIENDSSGYTYLRGIVAYYNGLPIAFRIMPMILHVIRWDEEVTEQFSIVATELNQPMLTVLRQVLDRMSIIYRQVNPDQKESEV